MVTLDNAVVVVAKNYWAAVTGLRALSPKWNSAGGEQYSTDSLFKQQYALISAGKPDSDAGGGDFNAALSKTGARKVESVFRVPFLHHAQIEPYALTAHFKDGKLEVWAGLQDPLKGRVAFAEQSGLDLENVTYHHQPIGGAFGRKNVGQAQVIGQLAKLAKQVPYPVKLIWSREEDVQQGCYRPQATARVTGVLDASGMMTAVRNDYADAIEAGADIGLPYTLSTLSMRYFKYESNQVFGVWRSVNCSHHCFFFESMVDELAELAGDDSYAFRRKHLKPGSRALRVLDEVALRSNWTAPAPTGIGRGIAIIECHGSVVANVVEASMGDSGKPKIHRVTCVVDCGVVVSPGAAARQVEGGIVMGLSAAVTEAITLENGKVQQANFHDYRLMQLGDTPEIEVHFVNSDAPIGGLGEPCWPAALPALTNALFKATGKRIRQLPIVRS